MPHLSVHAEPLGALAESMATPETTEGYLINGLLPSVGTARAFWRSAWNAS